MKYFKLIFLYCLFFLHCSAESLDLNQEARYKEVYQLAVSLARKKEFGNAINYFKYLLKMNPKDDKVRYLQAKAHYLSNSVSKALMVCNSVTDFSVQKKCNDIKLKAKREFPNDYKLFDAYRLFNEGKYQKSKRTVNKLIQLDPDNPKYRFILGKILHRQGDFYRAYDHYKYVKDFVNRRQRNKIQKSIAKLLNLATPLIEYVKDNNPESSELEIDEYWQMYCLAIHIAAPEIAKEKEGLTGLAISFLEDLLENQKLDKSKRFNVLMPMVDLYSLRGDAERAYEIVQLARLTRPDKADHARLDFAEELLRARHPTINKGMLKALK